MPDKNQAEYIGSKAFQRHVKRYVQAQVHRFAAVVPSELAELCRNELHSLGFQDAAITEAGVEFEGELDACYQANLQLRTASRILCRMASFRAGIAEELFYKVTRIQWELWLNPTVPVHAEAHVERSRIEHEGDLADTILAGIEKRFRSLGVAPPRRRTPPAEDDESQAPVRWSQRILARMVRNHCEISLDTTGPHLHERGYRLRHTGAPLRETLASAILLRSGWRGDSPLLDGMCGAGTIAIEGSLLSRGIPPGISREFLFEKWPSFREKTWAHLRRKAVESAFPRAQFPITAADEDAQAVTIAKENAERAGVMEDIRWEVGDFFSLNPKALDLRPGFLALDPPYGKRLSGGGGELYERIGRHLKDAYAGWRVAVLAPERGLAASLRLPSVRFWTIRHGGLPVTVAMGRV